jgi:chromosome segregation ATPase
MATKPDLASIAKGIDNIAVEVAKNGLAIAEFRREMTIGFDRIGRLETRVEGVEGRLEGVEGRLEGVEGRLGGVEREVKGMRSDIADLRQRTR